MSSIRPTPGGARRVRASAAARPAAHPARARALRKATARDGETFGALLRRLGASDAAVDRFWDVFIRPALNLPADEVDAGAGLFTVRRRSSGRARTPTSCCRVKPLGEMHGDAAGRALEAAGATVRLGERVESLDELDADAIVVAIPPRESARLLDEPDPGYEDSPIVSVHLWFDRTLLDDAARGAAVARTRTGCSTAAR